MSGGNKTKAINKTPSKVIINMGIAVETLNKKQIKSLYEIIDVLRERDHKYERNAKVN